MMSIELHCPKCSKLIRAPENAGGKHGKCPYCGNTVYVPLPPDESEEIGLAPIDDDAERQAEELRRESARYAALLDQGDGGLPDDQPKGGRRTSERPGEVVDMPEEVQKFVVAMHGSNLEEAEAAAIRLGRAGQRAKDYVEGLTLDEVPPSFASVPPPLAKGFLKALLNRLNE